MDTNTTPRIERLTREALGGPCAPPNAKPQPEAGEDLSKWERVRRILGSVILSVFAIGLWTLGILSALRPFV